MKEERMYDVGVIVGRFQVDDLHDVHRDLINHVRENHDKVLVVLGCSVVPCTLNNPLDYQSREQMILAQYPDVTVLPLEDTWSDEAWSKALDGIVGRFCGPNQKAKLYGGRDSFISAYTGLYPTSPLRQEGHLSGSGVREAIRRRSINSADFRAGVIWAAGNRFPTVYSTADIGIFNRSWANIVLGRKPYETGWRLPGGFADVPSPTIEADAIREALEETGCKIGHATYLSSHKIEDWRYSKEPDCVRTYLFVGTTDDDPVAADDLVEAKWFWPHEIKKNDYEMVMPQHRELVRLCCEYAYAMTLQEAL